jgi:acetylornithine aminotransferase
MIGIELKFSVKELRHKLLFEHLIFTGFSGQNIVRLLPPLTLNFEQADEFIAAFKQVFSELSDSINRN